MVPLKCIYLEPRHQHPIQDHLHSTVGIILTIINNTWVPPLPKAPTAASYWLWHAATHSLCPLARPSVFLSSCGTSTPTEGSSNNQTLFCSHKKGQRGPMINHISKTLLYGHVFWVIGSSFRLLPHHTEQNSSNRLFSMISDDWVQLKQLKCHFWISQIFQHWFLDIFCYLATLMCDHWSGRFIEACHTPRWMAK